LRNNHLKSKVLLLSLLIGVLVAFSSPPTVYSQFVPCNIVNLAISGPPAVGVGQTLEITTIVTGSCDASMFYAVRVDLVDAHSNEVLSKVIFPYAPVTIGFSVPITNKVTAPSVLGTWVLQINAYLIATLNGGVADSSQQLFSVNVVPYVTPTTTAQVATNSTTFSEMFTTSQMTSTRETTSEMSTMSTSSSSAAAQENVNPTSIVAIGAIIAIIVVIVLMLLKRKPATTSRPQAMPAENVRYCGHCGSKLEMADEFCGHCGTKQT
jgi:hypothetical protein